MKYLGSRAFQKQLFYAPAVGIYACYLGISLSIHTALQAVFSGAGLKAHSEDHASENGSFSNVAMNGSEVFKFAVRAVPAVSQAERETQGS